MVGWVKVKKKDRFTLAEVKFDLNKDDFIAWVGCGEGHSLAVSSSGRLYAWGSGDLQQLGIGDESDKDVPTLVNSKLFADRLVVQALGGSQHSLILVIHDPAKPPPPPPQNKEETKQENKTKEENNNKKEENPNKDTSSAVPMDTTDPTTGAKTDTTTGKTTTGTGETPSAPTT